MFNDGHNDGLDDDDTLCEGLDLEQKFNKNKSPSNTGHTEEDILNRQDNKYQSAELSKTDNINIYISTKEN